jgi:deoxycytidylate deaminase
MTKNIKYPYMPEDGVIDYVSNSNEFMMAAKEQARKSNDQNTPTGAVVVSENKVIGGAHNKAPLSSPKLINLHRKYCIRKMLGVPSGKGYWLCPGCATNSSHAESRLSSEIQNQNIKDLENPELYLWGHWWCCKDCWDNMRKIGVHKVFLLEGSEKLFNRDSPENIIGKQFE